MTKQEALNVLIAVAHCSVGELLCEDCPRNKGWGDEIAPSPSEDTCLGWNEFEVAEAARVLRGVRLEGDDGTV